jgi:hypothetical protein
MTMKTTSSLSMGLIIKSLVTPAPPPPANWQASTMSSQQRIWQWVVVLCLANDCRACSPLPGQPFAHVLDPQVVWLLYNSKQLPQEQQSLTANW